MHYLTLITAEIPEITEDEQTNEAVKAQIDKLENEKESFPEKSSGILNLLIAACSSIRDEFSRAVASAATDILEPYHCDTENPDYPIKKLYPDFADYAEEYWGVSYHPEQEAYGFYYNPNAFLTGTPSADAGQTFSL